MENFKDVLLSQPPAMYSQPASTNIYLENYKGILLCDRPALSLNSKNDLALNGDVGGANHDKSFSPANRTGNPVGLGPSAELRALRERNQALRVQNQGKNRNKSQQVLSRHRRWLRSFANQLKHMKQADLDREVAAARRAARLREAATQRRLNPSNDDAFIDSLDPQQQQQQPYNPNKALEPFPSALKRGSSARPLPTAKAKPKWAMTEDEAFDDELHANDELLQFAQNLDYERFIGDFEVAEALGVMRDRVRQIARANHWTEDDIIRAAAQPTEDGPPSDDDDNEPREGKEGNERSFAPRQSSAGQAEARAALPARAALHPDEWDSSTGGAGRVLKGAIRQDARRLAERLLAASPSLQRVHTKQSLARVLQQCALQGDSSLDEAMGGKKLRFNHGGSCEIAGAATEALTAATAIGPTLTEEPKIAQYHPGDVGVGDGDERNVQNRRILLDLQQSKDRVQGLPYLYRCPAI